METFANMISTFASISPWILTGPLNALVGRGGRLEHPTGSGGSFQMLNIISVKQEAGFTLLFSWYFQLDTALLRIYNYLQRFAVGLEEVVLDQALFDGEFIQEFNEAEYKLKAVSQYVLVLWQLLERKYFCFIYHPQLGQGRAWDSTST